MASDGKQLIHVRFAADGSVMEIQDRPPGLNPQEWFARLSGTAGTSYQSLSGGRGLFRLSPEEIAALKATAQQ